MSPENRLIALMNPKDTTIHLLSTFLLRAHGYQVPPSMNTLGDLPLQVSLTLLRKAAASRLLLPKETQVAMTFSSSRSTAPQMNIVVPFIVISVSSTWLIV